MKKVHICILIISLILTSLADIAIAESQNQNISELSDISGHWAESAIKTAFEKGYVQGYADGTFKPNAEVTRAEFLKMLVAALKYNTVAASGSWYQPYVDAATKAGIYSKDFKNTTWNNAIPRKEMSLLAVRAGITGYKKDYDINRNLYEAAKAGIIQGVGKGEIAPDGVTTRAAAVAVIERVLQVKDGKKLPTDKYATSSAEILWHKTNILTMAPEYFENAKVEDNKPWEFNYTAMKSADKSNKFVCEVESFVVVDLSDPNDPNRKYITKGMKWGLFNDYHDFKSTMNAYLLVSNVKFTVKGKVDTPVLSCSVDVTNRGFYEDMDEKIDIDNLKRDYQFGKYEQESRTILMPFVDLSIGDVVRNYSGLIIPKGMNTDKKFQVNFVNHGYFSDATVIYRSYKK